MKAILLTMGLVVAQSLTASAYAQDPVRQQARQEAQKESHSHQTGEGNPVPAATSRAGKQEKAAGHASRKQEGATEARQAHNAEGNPVPVAQSKVPKSERVAARSKRKAETAQANKNGEITSKGEQQ